MKHAFVVRGWFISLLMVCASASVQGKTALDDPQAVQTQTLAPSPPAVNVRIPDYFNLFGFGLFLVMQLFPAKVTDTLPNNLITLDPRLVFYKLQVCKRAGVTDCMPYGNSSNGVPANIQGIWWTDGLGDKSLAISSGGGPYDAKTRVLEVSTYANRQWAWEASDSIWQGYYWQESGAASYQVGLQTRVNYLIHLNEDTTFGQIVLTLTAFGTRIEIPTWFADFTMQYLGEGVWDRKSYGLFVDVLIGDYKLKRIINGDGSKGPWFTKGWLTYRDGIPLVTGVQIYPTQ
eukprot:jgi/Botrbrau1/2330/Bobra.39_1s0019.1